MKLGEILLLKTARFEQHHGQRIAQDQHHRGAGGRREIQRTGFLRDVYIQMNVAVLREKRFRVLRCRSSWWFLAA